MMSKNTKPIRDYIGDDGEFIYSIDDYLEDRYGYWEPVDEFVPSDTFTQSGLVRFPDEYLDYLENYHEVYKEPTHEHLLPWIIISFAVFLFILESLD